jgi:PTS system mannose-specific IIA component
VVILTGILLITHGTFSEGIVDSLELLMGKTEKIDTLVLKLGQDVRELKTSIEKKIQKLDDGDGVLVLVDIIGGSPYNMVAQFLKNFNVECVTGLNLPMLVEAANSRENLKMSELVDLCIEAGTSSIVSVRERLNLK